MIDINKQDMRNIILCIMLLFSVNVSAQKNKMKNDISNALRNEKREVSCSKNYETQKLRRYLKKRGLFLMSYQGYDDMKYGELTNYTTSFEFMTLEEKKAKNEIDRLKRIENQKKAEAKRIAMKKANDDVSLLMVGAALAYFGYVADATIEQTKEAWATIKKEGLLPDKECKEGVDYVVEYSNNASIRVQQFTKSTYNSVRLYTRNEEKKYDKNYNSKFYKNKGLAKYELIKEYTDSYKDNDGVSFISSSSFPIKVTVSYLNVNNQVTSASIIINKPGKYYVTVVD